MEKQNKNGFQRSSFDVIERKSTSNDIASINYTFHLKNDRSGRLQKIMDIIGGFGTPINTFIVDTKHPNGYEMHTICSNGIIVIQNENTERFVTALIARPQQVKRYYEYLGLPIPIEVYVVLNKCKDNQDKGYNEW